MTHTGSVVARTWILTFVAVALLAAGAAVAALLAWPQGAVGASSSGLASPYEIGSVGILVITVTSFRGSRLASLVAPTPGVSGSPT